MDERALVYGPRAERDLLAIPARDALRVLEDLKLLRTPVWPPRKVKKLHGTDFWEVKTGDYRTIFWPQRSRVVILRVVNRRDLEWALDRIDLRALVEWLRQRAE